MAAPAPSPVPDGEAAIAPPPPGMLAMPPRTASAQVVLDFIANADVQRSAVDELLRLLMLFRSESVVQLSPVQVLWQYGEFIRVALEKGRVHLALGLAHRINIGMLASSTGVDLFAGPGRDEEMVEYINDRQLRAATLAGINELLFLAYYVPLCPDLGASLALLRLIVRAARVVPALAQQLTPGWIVHLLQVDAGRFYVHAFPPHVSNWFHVMRRDHTLAAARWLLGPTRPLPLAVVENSASWTIAAVRDIVYMPPTIGDLALNAILHAQPRSMLLRVRTTVEQYWKVAADVRRALAKIDQHLAVHVPPTVNTARPAPAQTQIMDALVEQMARTAATDVPFDVASMVMDYVRRDDSVQAHGSRLTPYKQAENDYLRARIGAMGAGMAAERTTAGPSSSSAGQEAEEQQQQQHARLSARFPTATPLAHW